MSISYTVFEGPSGSKPGRVLRIGVAPNIGVARLQAQGDEIVLPTRAAEATEYLDVVTRQPRTRPELTLPTSITFDAAGTASINVPAGTKVWWVNAPHNIREVSGAVPLNEIDLGERQRLRLHVRPPYPYKEVEILMVKHVP